MPHELASVPQELLDAILAALYVDDNVRLHTAPVAARRTLCLDLPICRLVCRRWNNIATPRLFARIVVCKGGGRSFDDFLRFLITSPTTASYIRTLKLTVWTPLELEAALSAKTLQAMLPYMPRLDHLQLDSLKLLPTPDQQRRKDKHNFRNALRAYFLRLHSSNLRTLVRGRVLTSSPCPTTIFTLKNLSIHKVRMREDAVGQLTAILAFFSVINVLTIEDIQIYDGFGSWPATAYPVATAIVRTNHLALKDLRVLETPAEGVLPLLEKAVAFRHLTKLSIKLDLYRDARHLAWLLAQPSSPGTQLTDLAFDLNGIPWTRSTLSVLEQQNAEELSQALIQYLPNLHRFKFTCAMPSPSVNIPSSSVLSLASSNATSASSTPWDLPILFVSALPLSVAHVMLDISHAPSSETLWDSLTSHCKRLQKLKSFVVLVETPPSAMEKWERERVRWCTRELKATGVLFFGKSLGFSVSGASKAMGDMFNDEDNKGEEEEDGVPSCTQFGCVGPMTLAQRRHLPLFLL